MKQKEKKFSTINQQVQKPENKAGTMTREDTIVNILLRKNTKWNNNSNICR